MTIQVSAQAHPIVSLIGSIPFVDKRDLTTTQPAAEALQQMHDYIVCMNRTIPCNAAGTNVITLTMLDVQPFVEQYVSYEAYAFVAPATSTGPVTALVATADGNLATLKVYRNNGNQAGANDIKQNGLYRFIFSDGLDSGAGGFVIDGGIAAVIGNVSVLPVSGTGDDTTINANFTTLMTAVNDLIAAIRAG